MKRILAVLLMISLVLALGTPAAAAGELQHEYSSYANSGIRHEICTTLEGTSADSYYKGDYTYETLSKLDSDDLLTTLRLLMTDTHTKNSSYADCRDMAVRTDCENTDGVSISLLYTSYSATWDDWTNNAANGWNREHVWPQSLGGFKTSYAGADLHHVRPADERVNSIRGNLKYGNVSGGKAATAAISSTLSGGKYNSTYFEPLDNAKGDVARIILYMYVRYGSDSRYTCSSVTKVFESVDVLLEWCALDPVDTWEMGRNEVVADYQGNRNVFIDYPELAWLIFDRDIPANLVTPTSDSNKPEPCTHPNTTVYGNADATCTADGYTGDTVCKDCGQIVESGAAIPATGHKNSNGDQFCDICNASIPCEHGKTTTKNAKNATCTASGYSGDLYCAYCEEHLEKGEKIPATGHTEKLTGVIDVTCTTNGYTGDSVCTECGKILEKGKVLKAAGSHTYSEWVMIKEPTATTDGIQERKCTICGHQEGQTIPATGETEPPTQPSEPTEPVETTDPTETTAPTEATDPTPSQPETEPTQTEPTQSTAPTPDDDTDAPAEDSGALITIIVLAACAAGLIAFFVVNKRKKPDRSEA